MPARPRDLDATPLPNDAPDPVDERLTNLEVKASYADDLLDHLNRQVADQQALIDQLIRAVRELRAQVAESGSAGGGVPDERPPHW
jgi:SlyX protein